MADTLEKLRREKRGEFRSDGMTLDQISDESKEWVNEFGRQCERAGGEIVNEPYGGAVACRVGDEFSESYEGTTQPVDGSVVVTTTHWAEDPGNIIVTTESDDFRFEMQVDDLEKMPNFTTGR